MLLIFTSWKSLFYKIVPADDYDVRRKSVQLWDHLSRGVQGCDMNLCEASRKNVKQLHKFSWHDYYCINLHTSALAWCLHVQYCECTLWQSKIVPAHLCAIMNWHNF